MEPGRVPAVYSVDHGDCFVRAYVLTRPAADTQRRRIPDLRLHGPGLGVMTPDAPQGTPLEKNRGADARPIVDGIVGDVEDDPVGHVSTWQATCGVRSGI